jgi:O6-methylguanine-DNA--protein-cysteine methyltransferase
MMIKKDFYHSNLGWTGVAVSDRGICRIVLPRKSRNSVERELKGAEPEGRGDEQKAEQFLNKAIALLRRYFAGERIAFDLPLDIRSYTQFQQAVWRAAMEIPSGETQSYAWIAERIHRPRAARAVGQAMGANPIPIMIP